MQKKHILRRIPDPIRFILFFMAAFGICFLLSKIDDDNNPFAMGIFILAVALIARFTSGYFWGISGSILGTLCVNYCFTYPFWSFDITYPGYPLTVIVMLLVSMLVSTLTTQIKRQEQLRLEIERERIHADLLRAVAHDIRTPLAAILGASSALQEQEMSDEDKKALLVNIQKDAEWLVRVTENLLSVTRFSGNDAQLKKKDEVLEEIIGSAVLKYHRSDTALPISVDGPSDILLVPMDATLIEQVLLNLFDNVSVHAKGATRIWLQIEQKGNMVTLSVEDDGDGIPAARMASVLSGTEIHSSIRADDRRNMGIGLSVCRSIVRAHGGELSIEKSQSHGGTCVRFFLPCEERGS